ncbi:hypothetical protein B0J13DRAFT_108950 [Dactylonectria estremocensis]|uniref:Uncharacterized protein n=1 Tax=Dactylonectria estremocensis TaxID=1079267 RepID=A0A9P9JBT6_9HYPO|nr:hypothetical protein B0J13DRAFT_108950 [Dactylonectria estremocensis]
MAFRRLGVLCAAASLLTSTAIAAPSLDQKPIDAPDDQSVFIPEPEIPAENEGRAARIALYPASRTYPDDLRDMGKPLSACSERDKTEEIQLATDVCLSGEYYMRDNVKVLETPSCADGSTPTLMFYQHRHCTGSPHRVMYNVEGATGHCLWSEQDVPIASYYWSLIYRCNADAEGAVEHQEAVPALLYQNVAGASGSVRYHHGTTFPCHSDFANRTHSTTLKTGNCEWRFSSWLLETIEIVAPAVCSNGTRAQLALYQDIGKYGLDYMCNDGQITLENAIVDVDDWMLNTCISMNGLRLLSGGLGRALGVMFHCDGMRFLGQEVEEEKETMAVGTSIPRGPRVSHSECATSAGTWQWQDPVRPKTFMYPQPMTCMTLPEAHQLRIYEKPTCPDGTKGRLATWHDTGCLGWPKKIEVIDTLNCNSWDLRKPTSYKFWCGPEGLTAEERMLDIGDDRAVISTDECPRLNMEPGWTVVGRDEGSTTRRIDADTDCVSVWSDDQLKVYGNAKCPGGKPATLLKYADSRCRGKPAQTLDVASLLDTCTQICADSRRSCGIKFSCS